MEKLRRQINAQQRLVLKDLAASVRAIAEAQTEYALILPTPTHALIARNAERAAQAYPDDHTYAPKPYLSQTSLEDEPQNSAEYFSRLTAGVSPQARVLLSLIAGRWADATYTPVVCEVDKNKHGKGCKHGTRSVPFTLNALARDLYDGTGGKQSAQVLALLQELESVRITYGKTGEIQHEYAEEGTAALTYEPLVVSGLKGIGLKGESRDSLSAHLTLAKGLHEEYRTGSYQRIRRALLTGWTGWQQELALRLYSHIGTYYGGRRVLRSADKMSGTIRIGKTDSNPMDLGGLAHLLPSHGDNPKALHRKLEEFAAEVNRRSADYPTELHIKDIKPIQKGRHTEGWAIDFYYPEKPLTAKQRGRLKEAEGRRLLSALVSAPQTAAQKAEQAQAPEPAQRAAVQPLRIEVDSDGIEVVVLPAALPKPEPVQEGVPTCSHGVPFVLQPAGVSKAGKPYKAFWQARHKVLNGEWCKEKRERTS
jgi:hypothetical protein